MTASSEFGIQFRSRLEEFHESCADAAIFLTGFLDDTRTDEILHNLDAVQIQIEGKLLRLS